MDQLDNTDQDNNGDSEFKFFTVIEDTIAGISMFIAHLPYNFTFASYSPGEINISTLRVITPLKA